VKKSKLPQYSLGDVIDKLSILIRKIYFGEEAAYPEYQSIIKGLNASGINSHLITATIRLTMANIDIWNLENEIRKGGEKKFTLSEIGRRAIAIRNLNRKRVEYKNEINRTTKKGFREVKIRHQSQ